MANSAALVTDAFPRRELGRALGINAMVVGAGLILGPILGGWLTGFGWRLGLLVQPADRHHRHGRRGADPRRAGPPRLRACRIDWLGSLLYLVALMALMTALAFGGIYGWTTWWVSGGLVAFLVVFPLFICVERHVSAPLLDLSLFRRPPVRDGQPHRAC